MDLAAFGGSAMSALDPLLRLAVGLVGAVLWGAGLRLFLRSALSPRRKWAWFAFLVSVGAVIGLLLPHQVIWGKYLLLLALMPLLAAADLSLFGRRRGWLFWIRACGFEVGTVFGAAGAARLLLDVLQVAPILGRVR